MGSHCLALCLLLLGSFGACSSNSENVEPTPTPTPTATPEVPVFLGSCIIDVNPRCVEYTGTGTSAGIEEACGDPGQTFSADRCDTNGATALCTQTSLPNSPFTEVLTYFYVSDLASWQELCENNAGTWELL